VGIPAVSGSAHVGRTLTAVPGSWAPSPVSLGYQWKRNGVPVAGATGTRYVLAKADAGASITVTVTGRKLGYTTASRTTPPLKIARILTSSPIPTISGTAKPGATLTATSGTWGPGTVTLSYGWKRNGAPIAGATSRTYRLTGADGGRSVTVAVTGRKSGYTTVSKVSAERMVAAGG
jgi:hypothetical protein